MQLERLNSRLDKKVFFFIFFIAAGITHAVVDICDQPEAHKKDTMPYTQACFFVNEKYENVISSNIATSDARIRTSA